MTPGDARTTVVVPALNALALYTQQAEYLLMGTAAIESNFINFVQFGGGPARGMFQMEQATYDDTVNRYLAFPGNAALRTSVFLLATNPASPTFAELPTNHQFAAALARVKYREIPAAIPTTLADQANYWWQYYNGMSPTGLRPPDYLNRWQTYCAALYPNFT
jgi:hypothetical protein